MYIDGYANTANTEADIETINKLVSDHPTDFGGSMSAIEDSLKNAELNIQWNDLHLENVVQWLKEQYPETETTTPKTTPETTSETTPETTVPETTVPETTLPETTVPETTTMTTPETTPTTSSAPCFNSFGFTPILGFAIYHLL